MWTSGLRIKIMWVLKIKKDEYLIMIKHLFTDKYLNMDTEKAWFKISFPVWITEIIK